MRNIRERIVTIYECKGYQPDSRVGLREVEKWVEEKVPTIFNALRREQRFADSQIRFEFWTCGGFAPDATDLLEGAQSSLRRYSIDWKDGKAIQEYAGSLSAPGVKKILDEHYLKHPVTRSSGETSPDAPNRVGSATTPIEP